jgi:hypothetical protein
MDVESRLIDPMPDVEDLPLRSADRQVSQELQQAYRRTWRLCRAGRERRRHRELIIHL